MIRFVLITIALIFGANIVSASNDISQFVFTNHPQTIKPNEISEIITIQSQDANGNSATSTQTICLELASASNTGEFSSSNTNWSPIKVLTMSKGSANRNFYYKDSVAGVYELSIEVSLKPEGKPACAAWPKEEWDIKWRAKQNIVVSSSFSNSSSQESFSSSFSSSSSNENIASGSVDYHYKNEQISAKAGEDKTAVAGADIILEGKAYGFKKEPLENARYLWNPGDGSYKEGRNIRHIYKYPGNYIAVLNVSSGDISASDRINIKVVPNELQIIDAKDEFIKLKNKSGIILDVSGWFLAGGGVSFKFPESSFIVANSELVISSDVSKIKFGGKDIKADLIYSNGSVASSYQNKKETKPQPIMPEVATEAVAVSSSSHTDKITQIIQPPKKPKPTTVVGFGTTTQLASVITIGDKNNNGNKIWLILAVITGIIGGAGIFLARRNN